MANESPTKSWCFTRTSDETMPWDHGISEKRQALQMTRVPGKFGVGPGWFLDVPREAKWLLYFRIFR